MNDSYLVNSRIYFDDENKIRMIDSESSASTHQLINLCKDFQKDIVDFKEIVDKLIQIVLKVSSSVENVKIKAIGSRISLESISKEKQSKKRELNNLLNEKQQELQKLLFEEQSLTNEELKQIEIIDQLSNYR